MRMLRMHCAFCRRELVYVHGHAACANNQCPMFGANQAECCSGETAETCPAVVIGRTEDRPRESSHSRSR